MSKVKRQDLMLDQSPPRSLRELVIEQLDYTQRDGKTVPVASIDELLKRIYKHIEAEAIKAFKSNQLWAIKAWTYEHILEDSTAKQAAITDESLLDELVSPICAWQKGEFDPILNFRRTLELSERTRGTIKEYMRVAHKLVGKYGKKRTYSQEELLEFLHDEHTRYSQGTYITRVRILKSFLDSLPEDETGRQPKLPIKKIPPYPKDLNQPYFTPEEIDRLIYWSVLEAKPDMTLRLCIASIYGSRVGEMATLSSENINLDHENSSIRIETEKRGMRVPQPIPVELTPLFSVPLKPMKAQTIQSQLKRLCKKAGVATPPRTGIHSIRRSVATVLYSNTDLKELSIRRFLRWAEGGYNMGVMPRYVKTPVSVTDREVINKHPYVAMWKDMMQFLPYLPQYDSVCAICVICTAVSVPQ
jgi:integrase